MKTPVLFRRDRGGEITAVLPDVEANAYELTCYAHVGQHSACTRDWYVTTRAAKPAEYADLLAELTQIYGPMEVKRRLGRGAFARWAR